MAGRSAASGAGWRLQRRSARLEKRDPNRPEIAARSSQTGPLDELVARAKVGERAAISELYAAHVDLVYGYLRSNGCQDAEDATADVFTNMVRRIASFEGGGVAFRAWLMTIAHNRLVDSRRKRNRRVTELLGLRASIDDVDGNEPQPWQVDRDRTPILLDREIVEAMQSLTEQQGEVLGLRFLADLSIEEVAGITGRSVTATKALQRRALATVRRYLAETAPKGGGNNSTPNLKPQVGVREVRHVR